MGYKVHPKNCKCRRCKTYKQDKKDIKRVYVIIGAMLIGFCLI